ncbi:MAG: isoleucine--tRNA ligase [Candidatus Heimdallarchaeota archaeon]
MAGSVELFTPVDSMFDWRIVEESVLQFWKKHQIFKRLQAQLSNSQVRRFSFIDGPITANNPMGVHHARGRALKDIYQRYMTMCGYSQRFQNGFDTQGLWVEVEVEKALGINSKREIEEIGIDKFAHHCTSRVKQYSALITEQSKRLGQFMDWEQSYYTHSDRNIEHIWYFLKTCHQRGWLYQSRLVMPWCPRCSTSLSSHEMADSYRLVKHPSVYLQLPVEGKPNRYFLVWTTTPWTLPANTALAVHPKAPYLLVKLKEDNREIYISESSTSVLGKEYEVLARIQGDDLLSLRYHAPFAELPIQNQVMHRLVSWKDVTTHEGTGIVHIAPGCGAEDFDLGKRHNLAVIAPIDEHGRLVAETRQFAGLTTSEAAGPILETIKQKGLLYKQDIVKHRYPVCWRCKTELLFKLETEWFIRVDEIKPALLAAIDTVNWIPPYAGKRMRNWLENMGDWCISRKRFWGLPLPFYPCKCGFITVIGSRSELIESAIDQTQVDTLYEIHRPWIDDILVRCLECGQPVRRVLEVGDCWLDAGIVPFSTLDYLTEPDRKTWNRWFPADLVCEMIEQVRLWFYAQLFMAVTLEKRAPFKNVVTYDEVRHEDGSSMSKSSKMITFEEALEKSNADVLRWNYARQRLDLFLRFGFNILSQVKRTFIPYWNAVRFFLNFASLDIQELDQLNHRSQNVFDQWISVRLRRLIIKYHDSLSRWDVRTPCLLLEEFIGDLTKWYIRSCRRRFWKEKDSQDKNAAYSTLYHIILNLNYLLAPFVPFLAEYVYQFLRQPFLNLPESVHLCKLPTTKEEPESHSLHTEFMVYQQLVELNRTLRGKNKIKLRQPLSSAVIIGDVPFKSSGNTKQFIDALRNEFNVRKLLWIQDSAQFQADGTGYVHQKLTESNLDVFLNTSLTTELKQEGVAREIVRLIQKLRKKANLEWNDQIRVQYDAQAHFLVKSIEDFTEYIKTETLARSIERNHLNQNQAFPIGKAKLKLAIEAVF